MDYKLIKHKGILVIVISLLIVLISYVLNINHIENNICGTWKHSGGIDNLPDFLYIETNEDFNGPVYSKGILYNNGEPNAIPLLCTEDNLIIYYYNKGFVRYSRK